MGGLFSKETPLNYVHDLQNRLEKIERLDINNDHVISKKEFEKWKNTDLIVIKESIKEEVKKEYKYKLKKITSKVDTLNKEIDGLQSVNKDLEKSLLEKNKMIERLGSNIKTDDDVKDLIKMLSKEQIDKYVEELLADEDINIKYLPDFVERQIYRNSFKLFIKLMNKILGTMSFELIGHKLHMNMIPKNDNTYTVENDD